MSDPYHYVIVRADLPRGAQVAQVVHAAGESAVCRPEAVGDQTRAVVLVVKDEVDLRAVALHLENQSVAHRRITEAEGGLAGQLVAVGVVPQVKSERLTSCLGGLAILK